MLYKEEGYTMRNNHSSNEKYPKVKIIRYIIPLVLIWVVVGLLATKMTTIENTLEVIQSMPLWLIGFVILAQVGSYLGSGFVLSGIMKLGNIKLSIGRGALITMAAASIGLVAVLSYRLVSFWLPTLLGFVVMLYLQKTSGTKNTSSNS